MKRVLLTLGMGVMVTQVSAQFVNNGSIHVSGGAIVSIGMDVTNNGTINNNGNLELKADLQNNADFNSAGLLSLKGDSPLSISGSKSVHASNVALDGDVLLRTPLEVGQSLEFSNGLVFTEGNGSVNFGPNASHRLASDFSHVVGTVKKTGSGAFEFPVGDSYSKKAFEVTDLNGRTVEGTYVANSPLDVSSELDYDVESINTQEYWAIKADNDTKVDVSLANNDVVSLNKGLWVNKSGVVLSKSGSLFTSGKGKNFVKEIGVWPNPTSGEFNLKLSGMRDSDDITVDITNQDGTVVQSMKGKVSELRKAYRLPSGLVTTNLKVRVVNGDEVLTQSLILNK